MNSTKVFQWLGRHQRAIRISSVPMLVTLVAGVYLLVYATGGIKYVYSHSMYVPILLAGFTFGVRGGVVVGMLGGIALGPFMPIDVATGEPQELVNWMYRTGFFTLAGFLSGAASDTVKFHLNNLNWIACHDASTGMENRNALLAALGEAAREKSTSHSFVLAVVSLENVMELKSAFGFGIIEEIIRQSAERFKDGNPQKTKIYRTDTEQIGLLMTDGGAEDIALLIEGLIESSRHSFQFNGIPVHADSRVGYVTFNEVLEAPEVYLQRAESALIDAHRRAQDFVVYSPQINTAAKETLSMLGALMKAVEQGQLSLHYQPKIAVSTGDVHSAEALIRWHHPERGSVSPGVFIPRAEQSTLIHFITKFALNETMKQIVRWRKKGLSIPIAVNISPRNLSHPEFSEMVLRLLDQYKLDGDCLELEVTEGALMADIEHAIRELSRLADAQVVISVDDFGAGHSSLQYLHQLPISYIKVDQSFVRRASADTGAAHIVEAAIALAHKMKMSAIAEGIEDEQTYKLLESFGCDVAQGFWISRPLPEEKFMEWCTRHKERFPYTET
jgi:EAL domain-containing protein (putative c-di-GMP-specific phosphodiesterase class I)